MELELELGFGMGWIGWNGIRIENAIEIGNGIE